MSNKNKHRSNIEKVIITSIKTLIEEFNSSPKNFFGLNRLSEHVLHGYLYCDLTAHLPATFIVRREHKTGKYKRGKDKILKECERGGKPGQVDFVILDNLKNLLAGIEIECTTKNFETYFEPHLVNDCIKLKELAGEKCIQSILCFSWHQGLTNHVKKILEENEVKEYLIGVNFVYIEQGETNPIKLDVLGWLK